jgi:TolB-like protein
MDVLVCLAEHPNELVSRDELLDTVWSGSTASDEQLTRAIGELRRALNDDRGDPKYIETVPKRGYRLIRDIQLLDSKRLETDLSRSQSISRLKEHRLAISIVFALSLVLIYFAYDEFVIGPAREEVPATTSTQVEDISGSNRPRMSIAVLPFVNLSDDPGNEYFADGLAEELLNSLAAIGDLRVISRKSSFAFKGRNVSIAEIAAALKVDHILDGSVRRAGNTVRVTAQLVDTSSDSHIWSDTYDRELSLDNILEIQDEIAVKVVDALNVRLLPPESAMLSADRPAKESAMLSADRPANLHALDLYHDGMFYLHKIGTGQSNSRATFDTAINNFKGAIAADPSWAPPHAALGRTYHFLHSTLDDLDKLESMRMSKRHVMDAIRLDGDYGPAYGSLGYILTMAGDIDGATRAYDRARSLNVDVSWGNAILMSFLGRYDVAIDEYRNAISNDPLSIDIRIQLVETYLCSGRYADAIRAIESDAELFANSTVSDDASLLLAESYLRIGDTDKGLQWAASLAEETGTDLSVALMFALAGETERARLLLDSKEIAGTRRLSQAAMAFAALGERNLALEMLERAVDAASNEAWPFIVLAYIQCSPEIRRLGGNARYESLLDRLGLPD